MIIDGKKISEEIKNEIKKDIISLKEKGVTPTLATILIGDNPASMVYINQKIKKCKDLEINSEHFKLDKGVSEKEVLALIEKLNKDKKITGILVQLPLPEGINQEKILLGISPKKDADGFHPQNQGVLFSKKTWGDIQRANLPLPCTAAGIIELLFRTGIEIKGKHSVVVGRSIIVGKPVAVLLLANDSTVTLCHSRTKELSEISTQADILIAAIGKPAFIKEDMVKEGAAVIDVGVNRTEKGLVGDVEFETVSKKAGWITPVPGGVGPMTVIMLMRNTVNLAMRQIKE